MISAKVVEVTVDIDIGSQNATALLIIILLNRTHVSLYL